MMMKYDWKSIPIPDKIKSLEKDSRGIPIPFLAMRDIDGTPHFTVNDHTRHLQCLAEDRCGICGKRLLRGRSFVGGPMSAFHPQGCYIDPPMHQECAEYALRVCPYLAAPKYIKRIDEAKIDPSKIPNSIILQDSTTIPARPPLFVMVTSVKQRVWQNQTQMRSRSHHISRFLTGRMESNSTARPVRKSAWEN
jgi:hypothetical protein